jgi:hypothetical protein
MINDIKELEVGEKATNEQLDQKIREKLGIGFSEMTEALCLSVKERAVELVEEIANIAPNGDYGKLIEDKELMAKFLQEEAAKPENWIIQFIETKKKDSGLIEFVFFNKTVDDGDIFKGFVFVGKSGKIRHAFAQIQS